MVSTITILTISPKLDLWRLEYDFPILGGCPSLGGSALVDSKIRGNATYNMPRHYPRVFDSDIRVT